MAIKNLTPHAITIVLTGISGDRITIPPEPALARVGSTSGGFLAHIEGIPVHDCDVVGAVEGLPPPEEGTYYIVSAIVGSALTPERRAVGDVLVPGTGPLDSAIRVADGPRKGQIEAVTRLKRA